MKTVYWISYPLLLAPFFSESQAIAGETESFQADWTLAAFLLGQQPDVTPAPIPATPVGSHRQQFEPPPSGAARVMPFVRPAVAQSKSPQPSQTTIEPRFLIAPRVVKLKQVNPRTTQIPINEVQTVHQSQSETTVGVESGESRNLTTSLNAIKLYSPHVEESISGKGVYRIEYTNIYNQIKTVRQQRDLMTTLVTPETNLGMRQQISLIGDCANLQASSSSAASTGADRLCTYLPGIFTDNTSIDPDTLTPTGITQRSKFGEVVSPESLAAIVQPGFQAGANGQLLGVDLYFPRIGSEEGNSSNSWARIDRREQLTNVPAVTTGRIQQVLVSNGEDSGISRTMRGYTFVIGDRNTALTGGLQLLSTALPNAEPQLAPGIPGRSAGINPHLIFAANNVRLPENSFTSYSAGWGYASNRDDIKTRTPAPASYNTIWFGLSPVVDRQIASTSRYQITSSERIKLAAGGEGGAQSSFNTVTSINGLPFDSSGIASAYSQIYLTLFNQDVDRINTTKLRETTEYYPHLSFSGNTTTGNSVFRYYTGAMIDAGLTTRKSDRQIKAYGGVDFNKTEGSGLNYNIGVLGYTNPDPEYYSRITADISQQIALGRNLANNLLLNAGINYAIDGATEFDKVRFQSGSSFIKTGATVNLGNVALNTTYFIPSGLPNQINSLLSTSLTWKIKDNIAISGYYTPVNNNSVKSPYGINAAVKFGTDYYGPTLLLSWNRNEISFGQSSAGTSVSSNENVFSISFSFGEALNLGKSRQ